MPYSVTIFGYRKEGMSEKEYHDYASKVHSGHLKTLLAKNGILYYAMQHNTSESRTMLAALYPGLPAEKEHDCNIIIQIVFKDIADYLRAKEDEHWEKVVNPDHANFADMTKTRFVTGEYEVHVKDGRVVS